MSPFAPRKVVLSQKERRLYQLCGAENTGHSKINENLALPDNPSTTAVFEFVGETTRKRYSMVDQSGLIQPAGVPVSALTRLPSFARMARLLQMASTAILKKGGFAP